jgi:hypothetical protein
MKKVVFFDVAPCRCVYGSFGGTYRFHLQVRRKKEMGERGTSLSAPAHAGLSLAGFLFSSILKMEAIHSSETSVNTISTRRYIPEDGFLQY